jgi:hypothetical protein
MNKAINERPRNPELVEKTRNRRAADAGSPASFGEFINEERARWIPVAKSLNVKAD